MRFIEGYRTVRFNITNFEKFKPMWHLIMDAMAEKDKIEGCEVGAVTVGDLFDDYRKLEEYNEYLLNLLDHGCIDYELFDDFNEMKETSNDKEG
jgi:hypothetical protein